MRATHQAQVKPPTEHLPSGGSLRNTLTDRLERILDAGCVHILWNELYRWYEVKKIAAGTYRDLTQRWQEVSEGKYGHLQMVEAGGGIYLFASKALEPLPGE